MRLRPRYQYRLVWQYKGQTRKRILVAEQPSRVLRMLRRIGTRQPWLGVTEIQFRRAWAWLARRLYVPFAAVADIPADDILLRLQDSFPALDYIRVEHRQVGEWTELLDPLHTLRTPSASKIVAKAEAVAEKARHMSRAELDAWRWIPSDESQRLRTRGDR